ncbi:hypothetical protein DOY81_007115, partial [Sarcophaga bullata]
MVFIPMKLAHTILSATNEKQTVNKYELTKNSVIRNPHMNTNKTTHN